MKTHADVQPGVWSVRNLEDHRSSQKVQSHRSYLRYVPITCLNILGRYSNFNPFHTNSSWHTRHDHELIRHGVDIVHIELADAVVQRGIEEVHEVYQL